MSFANPDGTFFTETGRVPIRVALNLASGSTILVKTGTTRLYIIGGTLATLTIQMPPILSAGQEFAVSTINPVTALTLRDQYGIQMGGFPASLASYQPLVIVAVPFGGPGSAPAWTRWA